jgi:hypothetical protein
MKDEIIAYSKIAGISVGKGVLIGVIGVLICLVVLISASFQLYTILEDHSLGSAGHSPVGGFAAIFILLEMDPFATIAFIVSCVSLVWVIFFAYRTVINTAINKIWEKGGKVKEMIENRIHRTAKSVAESFPKWDDNINYAKTKLAMLKANSKDPDKSWIRRKVSRFIVKRIRMEDRELNLTREEFPYAVNQAVSNFINERTSTIYWPFVLNMIVLLLLMIISWFI